MTVGAVAKTMDQISYFWFAVIFLALCLANARLGKILNTLRDIVEEEDKR